MSNIENANAGQEILQDSQEPPVLTYVKKRFTFIFGWGVFLLVIAAALGAAFFLLTPRHKVYSLKCTILLDKNNGTFCYPSEKTFSDDDLISLPVLQKVYKDFQLEKKIKFNDFRAAFSIVQDNFKEAALDALYQQKLAKKTLSVVDVQKLEEEYKNEKAKFASAEIKIVMDSRFGLSNAAAAEILCAIPKTWYSIYSRLEAKVFIELDNSGLIKQLDQDTKSGSMFIPLQKARLICQRMLKNCETLEKMQKSRNIKLANGENIEDLVAQINALNDYHICLFSLYIQRNKEFQGGLDRVFIVSRIQELGRALFRLNAQYNAALQARTLLAPSAGVTTGKQSKENGDATVQLSSSFLDSLTALVQKSMNAGLLAQYADKMLKIKDSCAELESEKNYYEKMLSGETGKNDSNRVLAGMTGAGLKQGVAYSFKELGKLNDAVVAMKKKIAEEYLTSREFYSSLNNVSQITVYSKPLLGVLAGFVVLAFAVWLIICGADFAKMSKNGKLSEGK